MAPATWLLTCLPVGPSAMPKSPAVKNTGINVSSHAIPTRTQALWSISVAQLRTTSSMCRSSSIMTPQMAYLTAHIL